MSIKIVYDVTILGNNFARIDSKTGIYRVTEILISEIIKKKEVDLYLIGICGEVPLLNSTSCNLYFQKYIRSHDCKFINSFESKLGLNWFYKLISEKYFTSEFQALPRFSLRSVPIRGMLKLLSTLRLSEYDSCQKFDSENYDLFHSTYHKLPSEKLTGGMPRLLMVHDLIPIKTPNFVEPGVTPYFRKILESINYEKDWIVCNSEYTKQEFCEYTRMSPERVFVTPLAADNHFQPVNELNCIAEARRRFKVPEGDYFLCLASQLEPRKNLSHLIRCFIRLITENPTIDINLVLVGTNRYKRTELESISQDILQFQNRVIFTGYVQDEDLSILYSDATAFIFPSLYEGFGLPILEAMQCGTPVITSNSTSLPEVAGDAAILVDPKDEDTLCQAMLNLLSEPDLRKQLSQKGLERAKQFSWAKCAAETVEIYEKIISSK
jgi:glycosyltransferase involved in cell wall biosynthesis